MCPCHFFMKIYKKTTLCYANIKLQVLAPFAENSAFSKNVRILRELITAQSLPYY